MKTFRKWVRIIHRDLGFIMVGLCLVYGVSGFVLNHMGKHNPAYKTIEGTVQLSPNLKPEAIKDAWEKQDDLPEIMQVTQVNEDHYRLIFNGGIGVYSLNSGIVEYEQHRKKVIIYYLNKLHYNNVTGWTVIGDIFAVSLIFFAVSGLIMVRGKKGLSGTGKWFVLLGLLIPVFYILFM